jgi:signal transduction histidine kinase
MRIPLIILLLFCCAVSLKAQLVDMAHSQLLLKNCEKIIYSQPDSALIICNEVISLDPNQIAPGILSRAHRFKGIAYEMRGEFDKSMLEYAVARPLAEKANDSIQIGNLLLAEGIIYQKLNNLELSLELYLKALEIYKTHNHARGISGALNNIGLIYLHLGMFEKAKQIYLEEIENSFARNDSSRLSSEYCNISYAYHDLEQYDSAFYYIRKSIEIDIKNKDFYGLANSHQTLGAIFSSSEQPDSAIYYFDLASTYFRSNNLIGDLIGTLGSKGGAYYRLKDYKTALLYSDSALAILDSLGGDFKTKYQLASMKALIFQELGDKDSQIENLQPSLAMIDSIKNQELKQTLLNFEISKQNKELEDEVLNERNQREKLTEANERQKSWLMGIIILLILTIIATSSLYQSWKLRNKYYDILNSRTKDLELDFENAKRMMSVLAHDFRAPLASVSMIFDHLNKDVISPKEKRELSKLAKKNLTTTLRGIDQLLFWISRDKKLRKPELINLSDAINAAEELHSIELESKNIQIIRENLEPAVFYFDSTHFEIISRNLIHNSLKFLDENGIIKVSYSESELEKIISFEDNGSGIEPYLLKQINEHEFHRVLPKRLQGSGLGLELIFDIVKLNNAHIVMESELGKGTRAIITIPKQKAI